MRVLSFLVAFFACSSFAYANTLVIQTVDEDGAWIENALVSISGAAISGRTQSGGIFESEIDAGDYQLRVQHGAFEAVQQDISVSDDTTRMRVVMTRTAADDTIDFTVNVGCVYSSVALPESDVVVEYSDSETGAPTELMTVVTDQNGNAQITGAPRGYYRFRVQRQNWEPLTLPAESLAQIDGSTTVGVSLEPIKVDGNAIVEGENIYGGAATPDVDFLFNIRIDAIGLDWDLETEVVPLKTVFSNGYRLGRRIPDLPQIPHRYVFSADGYETQEVIVDPADLGDVEVTMVPLQNEIQINIETFFDDPTDPPRVYLTRAGRGVTVQRIVDSTHVSGQDFVARIEKIPSGTYRVEVQQSGDGGPSIYNGVLYSFAGAPNTYWRTERSGAYLEVFEGQNTSMTMPPLKPKTNTVTGRLFEEYPVPGVARSETKKMGAGVRVQFVSQVDFTYIPDSNRVFETFTDATGNFSIELPGGRYGVKLPDLTTHVIGNVIQNRYDDTGYVYTVDRQGWQYGDRWSLAEQPDSNECGIACPSGGLLYSVEDDYEVKITARRAEGARNLILPCQRGFSFNPFSPVVGYFGGTFLQADQCMSPMPVVEIPNVATGMAIAESMPTQGSNEQTFYIGNIPPGDHNIQITHPFYDFAPIPFSTEDAVAPGVPPTSLDGIPLGKTYFPQLERDQPRTLKPEYELTGTVNIQCYSWNSVALEYYLNSIDVVEIVGDVVGMPGVRYRVRSDAYPVNLQLTNVYFGTDVLGPTFKWAGPFPSVSNGDTVSLNLNGPNESFTSDTTGSVSASLTVVAVTKDGEPVPVDIDVFGDGNDIVTTGGSGQTPTTITTDFRNGSPTITTAGWQRVEFSDSISSVSSLAITRTITVEQTISLAGTVTVDGDIRPFIPMMSIGYGGADEALGDAEAGAFSFTIPLKESYIQPDVHGFYPSQFAVDATTVSQSNLVFDLQPLPAPTIENFEINRHGAFVPGLFKSGDPMGFNSSAAKAALKATWRVDITPQMLSYTIQRPTGDTRPTSAPVDSIAAVYLVDPREFSGGLSSSTSQPIAIPSDLDFLAWTDLLRSLDRHKTVIREGTEVAPGQWQGTLNLWEMPPGELKPYIIAITEAGAVGVAEYQWPTGTKPLKGFGMSNGMQTILNFFGEVDNQPFALGKKPPFVPSTFQGMIDVSGAAQGVDTDDEAIRYFTYDYSTSGSYSKKVDAPQRGILAMAPNRIGFGARGELKLEITGNSDTPVKIQGQGTYSLPFGVDTRFGAPALISLLAKYGIPAPNLDLTPSMSAALATTGTIDSTGGLEEYTLETTFGGSLEVKLSFPIVRLLRFLGPPGAALSKILEFAVSVHTVSRVKIGGSVTDSIFTVKPSGTDAIPEGDKPARVGLFGVHNALVEALDPDKAKITFAAGYGMGAALAGERLSATVMLQLGGPADVRDDVRVDLRFDDGWSFVRRVRGAVSLVGKGSAKFVGFSFEKTLQYDGFRFDHQWNTEPFYEIPEGEYRTTYSTPATAEPAEWNGGTTPVTGIFKGSGSSSTESAVAWVSAIDGELHLWAANRDASQGELVRSAGGILDLVMVEDDGELVLVWSEITPEQVGDAFADSVVMTSRSADGTTWSEPEIVTQVTGVASGFEAAATTSGIVVTWVVPQGHAMAKDVTIWAAEIGGEAEMLFDASSWVSISVDAVGNQVVVTANRGEFGDSEQRVWSGTWTQPSVVGEYLWTTAYVDGGRFYSTISGGIFFEPDGESPVLISENADAARELDVVELADGNWGVGWLMVDEGDGVYTVTVDSTGGILADRVGVQAGPFTTLADLNLSADGNDINATIRTEKRTGYRLDIVAFPRGGDPVSPDLTDEGPSSDPTTLPTGPTDPPTNNMNNANNANNSNNGNNANNGNNVNNAGNNQNNLNGPDGQSGADGGCGCATQATEATWWPLLALLMFVGLRRRVSRRF